MPALIFHQENIVDQEAFMALCPFNALELSPQGQVQANAGCKMCGICVKKGPCGAAEILPDTESNPKLDKAQWRGVMVYVDHVAGRIHPVSYELLGKARALADSISQPVYALMLGQDISLQAQELLHYGVDEVLLADHTALGDFRIDAYGAVFEQAIHQRKPGSILVGATAVGRQLAPRVAAGLRTGLTADCTVLEMQENGNLVQIRPAFGGNIMAQILTPNHRPQIATVRYKVMDAPMRSPEPRGKITSMALEASWLTSPIEVLEVLKKQEEEGIEAAQVLIAAGRGIKKQEDLSLLMRLAELLGGQMACTRPLAESGWMEARRQIGLSGRTVRPKLIIACGISGAVQFTAGMNHAETIIAINSDENAPLFKTAHYGLVGDVYEILPRLIAFIEKGGYAL